MQIHVQHTTESPNGGSMDKIEQKGNSKWGWGGKPRLPSDESVFKWKEHDFKDNSGYKSQLCKAGQTTHPFEG